VSARGGAQPIPRPLSSRDGEPAPWAGLPATARQPSLGQIRDALVPPRAVMRSALEGTGVRASAVLALLYEHEGQVFVVLTRRAQHLRSHRGEVSLPGGAHDPDDADLWATALRESTEEIALDPTSVERVGELDHLQTVTSRSFIVPYVGLLPGRPDLEPNPSEVELILRVPLSELLADGVFREERWGLSPLDRPIFFFELMGDTVWGATAAMLRSLLAVVTGTGR